MGKWSYIDFMSETPRSNPKASSVFLKKANKNDFVIVNEILHVVNSIGSSAAVTFLNTDRTNDQISLNLSVIENSERKVLKNDEYGNLIYDLERVEKVKIINKKCICGGEYEPRNGVLKCNSCNEKLS